MKIFPPKSSLWRLLKALAFIGAVSLTIAALAMAAYSFAGRHEWSKTKQELLAKGERLSAAEFVPPPLPDEENFFADPLWVEVAEKKADAKVKAIGGSLSEGGRVMIKESYPEVGAVETETTIRKVGSQIRLSAGKNPEAVRRRAAEAILALQQPALPLLQHLDGLSQRPGARFPTNYEAGFAADLRHLVVLMNIEQVLRDRAWAQIQLGESKAAFATAGLMGRIVKAETGGFMINLLVRVSMIEMQLAVIEEGIVARQWSDENLAVFETELKARSLIGFLPEVLRAERGGFNSFCEELRKGSFDLKTLFPEEQDEPAIPRQLYLQVLSAADQAKYNQMMQAAIELVASRSQEGLNECQEPIRAFQEIRSENGRYLLTAMSASTVGGFLEKAVKTEARVREARVACALERYRLAHGELPAELDQLVPEYLDSVPVDPANGKLLQYRRDGADEFTLWSVGWNRADDGGAVKKFDGDWIWGRKLTPGR